MTTRGNFDFSLLFELLASMKRSFWSLERSEERFHKALNRAHSNHFAKLMPAARKRDHSGSLDGYENPAKSNMGSAVERAPRRQKREIQEAKKKREDHSTMEISKKRLS
jgi:hypothetical protein